MKKLFCILLLACTFAHGETTIPDLTAEQWRQDLDFFASEITTKDSAVCSASREPVVRAGQ
jgi:hypothetical protein